MTGTLIRILVVDDERAIRRFLSASLSGQYTVLEAASGEEALAMAVSGRPDVIVLDLGLPDMDGMEVTRRLREWTQIPIIVVSVRDQEEHKIAALDAGADDYLTKPFGVG
ncbi:MAG: response regulator, partial [Anaerolineales bacterium]